MRFIAALVVLLSLPLTAYSQQSIEGTVNVLTEDRYDKTSAERQIVKEDNGRVHPMPPGQRFRHGQRVRLRGNQVDLLRDEPATRNAPSNGVIKTLVFLVNLRDAQTTQDPAQAKTVTQASGQFWTANSYGKLTFPVVDVVGPYSAGANLSECAYSVWSNDAMAAARQRGVPVDNYTNYVFIAPGTGQCAWWGLGGGNMVWISGSYQTWVLSHEFGHDWGFAHAHSYACDVNGCAFSEYGDDHDVMGNVTEGWTNPYNKKFAGWLTPLTVRTSGTYTIYPVTAQSGTRALEIDIGNGNLFYVDFRQSPNRSATDGGVLIRSWNATNGSLLRDANPTGDYFQSVLYPTQAFVDPAVTITATSWDWWSETATITVTFPGSNQPTPAPRPGSGLSPRVY